jgi:hypothetical protein
MKYEIYPSCGFPFSGIAVVADAAISSIKRLAAGERFGPRGWIFDSNKYQS